MNAVWAIFFSAILGATFTAILISILTIRNRRLDKEKSKATLFYASREAEIAAREIKSKAEVEIERSRTELKRDEDRAKMELENSRRDLQRERHELETIRRQLDEQRQKHEQDVLSLKESRQSLGNQIRHYRRKLREIAGITQEEGRKFLLEEVEHECQGEIRAKRRALLEKGDKEVQQEARKTLLTVMQRLASQPHGDALSAVVDLPNDEMKGRIIGKEGRNIKSFEALSGTTLLIDESPQTLLISCFDPVRREIAKIAMINLIEDGRIHPASIEEFLQKAQEQVMAEVSSYGGEAVDKLKITGVHPDILSLLGKLRYRFSLNQNVLDHSVEVAFLCSMIASEIGLDPNVAKRAGLYHDIGKAVDHEYEGSHATIGADVLRRRGEPGAIVNAVAAHHEEVPAESLYAPVVIIADTLSAVRPGARIESHGNYLQRLERLEALAVELPGVLEAYAIQAGREIRVIVSPEKVGDEDAQQLARTLRRKIEEELQSPSVIKITVIREQRFIETAK